MEKLPYLKDKVLTNIPAVVRIVKRVGQYPETDYNTKQETGRMQTLYNFDLDGTTYRHYAKEREEEVLCLFKAGELVQVVRQEQTKADGKRIQFLVWTPTEGTEARAAATPQPQSNTRQTATQREMKENKENQEEKSIAICLQGFMQAYIAGTDFGTGNINSSGAVEQSLAYAVQAREALLKKAKEIHSGIPEMKHDPITAAEAAAAFGDDVPTFNPHAPSSL